MKNQQLFFVATLIFSVIVLISSQSQSLYEKYEKPVEGENYVQIYEIFRTRQKPTHEQMDETELNNFLAKDHWINNSTQNSNSSTGASNDTAKIPIKPLFPTNPKENKNPEYDNLYD